jgi:hypothetical protein
MYKKMKKGTSYLELAGKPGDFRAVDEPVFLNVYGAQESIPRNEFRQPM